LCTEIPELRRLLSELPKPSSDRVEKGAYRGIIVKRDALKGETTCFVQPPSSQPATLSEAKDDLKYVGPTWLDKQFGHPSPVVAPDILENINALKRERLEFLISINYLRKNESPPSLLIKDLRELEKKKFVREIRQNMKLSYLPDANHFSGKMHKKEVKLIGGTYIVVSSKTGFVVLPADRDLTKQKGKNVTLSKVKDKNGRIRFQASPNKSKDRGGWER